ncbi:NAD-dependent epimerase/dehydratase family protein [Cellulomonas fimi]|uniref:NAD-dependent epimerase/dehydratase family protein n=1 Tax=Cellulomonas fimi TaxID=1708 RepID=UPI002359DAB7|nr:NAD-dependent epimerase/dehydratase family protein [Cellulomonas fimi]
MAGTHRGRLLLTGGCGFIGTAQAQTALASGWRVVLLDARTSGTIADDAGLLDHEGVEVVEGDVTDPSVYDRVGSVDAVVHAAGFLGVQAVTDDPLRTLDVNILGSREVARFASRRPGTHLVLLSTSEVYGTHAVAVDERAAAVVPAGAGRWSYAASKIAAEQYAHAYARAAATPVTVVRPFNVYGPGRRGSYAVGEFVRRALAGEDLIVHGSGEHVRSWCHVRDFCAGVAAVLDTPAARGRTFNIGNPAEPLSVRALAELVVRRSGSRSRIVTVPGSDDVVERSPDISAAREVLGFEPQIGLEVGLDDVIAAAGGDDRSASRGVQETAEPPRLG